MICFNFPDLSELEGVGAQVSAEHLELVRRVRRSSSYYEILEVSRTCSDEDIRKAYRKVDGGVLFVLKDKEG